MRYIVQGIVGQGPGKGKVVYVTSVGSWYAWGQRHNAILFERYTDALFAGKQTKGPVFRAPDPFTIDVVEVE